MDKDTRHFIQRATQDARRLLEREYREQLEGLFDVLPDSGKIADEPGGHLDDLGRFLRTRIVAAIAHERLKVSTDKEAIAAFLRETAFTTLNRFAALKLMEARKILQECVSRGDQSAGFREFGGLAPGLADLPDHGYRLYLECLFDEIGLEVGALFDRRHSSGLLWPRRPALLELLEILNRTALAAIWAEDETIGWIYQYFNDDAERKKMREESAAPRNSRELAVRNQFFTPRYVVQFLTDNTLGRIWYEMRRGETVLKDRCRYLVRRPNEVFLGNPAVLSALHAAVPWVREVILSANFSQLPEDPTLGELSDFGLAIDGYGEMERRGRTWEDFIATFFNPQAEASEKSDQAWSGDAFELWCALFAFQREFLRQGWHGDEDRASGHPVLRHLWPALRQALANPKSDLPQEEALRQPHFIPYRALKDPREIRLLDPACGSMHFGLYAFDLYEAIYEEAWQLAAPQVEPENAGGSFIALARSYSSKEAFMREVPRLILEHNIHGIDIDPRAAQIAGFALWLRAQRAWAIQGVRAAHRPGIRKSNVVCAEPMPGDKGMLKEFTAGLNPPFLGQIVEKVWDAMLLAGEAGSLLKIEEQISDWVRESKKRWRDLPQSQQLQLFEPAAVYGVKKPEQEELPLDLTGITDGRFWEEAEERIYAGLRDFAAHAASGDLRQRLFTDDAIQGFAFIDLCRQKYDVVLMNPPFGDASLPSKSYLDENYEDTKGDVYKAFVEGFQARLIPSGYLGIISSRTGLFLGQSEDWRTRVVLRLYRPILLADLGLGVLDAMVEVAAYVLRKISTRQERDLTLSSVPKLKEVHLDTQERFGLSKWQAVRPKLKRHQAATELEHLESQGFVQRCEGTSLRYTPLWRAVATVTAPPKTAYPYLFCIRALADQDKGEAIEREILQQNPGSTFVCDPSTFYEIPGVPFAYWAGDTFRRLFEKLNPLECDEIMVRAGGQTSDDFRYLRAFWECLTPPSNGCWRTYVKGGGFSPFYNDPVLIALWSEHRNTFLGFLGRPGRSSEQPNNHDLYFRAGITWPLRAKAFSPQPMPGGSIFTVRGSAVLAPEEDLLALLGLLSSSTFDYIFKFLLGRFGFPEFAAGVLQKLPIPDMSSEDSLLLSNLSRRAWAEKRSVNTAVQTSHAFLIPAALAVEGASLKERITVWKRRVEVSEKEVGIIQNAINEIAFRLYDLNEIDREAVSASPLPEILLEDIIEDEEDEIEGTSTEFAFISEVVDYLCGSSVGHWDIRLATGSHVILLNDSPFAPLPICPLGMLKSSAGLPAEPADIPADYPLRISWSGILVDDPGSPEDIEARARECLQAIWGDRAEAIELEADQLLGVSSLREYFRRQFFSDHLQRYSKSRRQAPIYWPLSTVSGSYTIWLYYHRFNKDTFYRVREISEEKFRHEERRLSTLTQEAGPDPSTGQAKALSTQAKFVEELRDFHAEISRLVPLWNPDLNDGVILNFAPFHRLISHPKWRKDVTACWEKLAAGDYDWAHLALHLWPERVIPKCATDRSLAIAHGLDEVFWQPDPAKEGKFISKSPSSTEVDSLIANRRSPAVKSALASLAAQPTRAVTSRRKSRE